MKYLGNTFSPMMLPDEPGLEAKVMVFDLASIPLAGALTSIVSHEITAKVLSALLGAEVAFNRTNLTLRPGDELYVIIPNFRADVAREFTQEEVEAAGYRCFLVWVE